MYTSAAAGTKRISPEGRKIWNVIKVPSASSIPEEPQQSSCARCGCIDRATRLAAEKIAAAHEGELASNISWLRPRCHEPLLLFRCKYNHKIKMTLEQAKERWCKDCAKQFSQARKAAKEHGGAFVGMNQETKCARFRCARGHFFEYKSTHVYVSSFCIILLRQYMSWCPQCRKEDKSIDAEIEAAAAKRKHEENEREQVCLPRTNNSR